MWIVRGDTFSLFRGHAEIIKLLLVSSPVIEGEIFPDLCFPEGRPFWGPTAGDGHELKLILSIWWPHFLCGSQTPPLPRPAPWQREYHHFCPLSRFNFLFSSSSRVFPYVSIIFALCFKDCLLYSSKHLLGFIGGGFQGTYSSIVWVLICAKWVGKRIDKMEEHSIRRKVNNCRKQESTVVVC